MIKRLFVLFLIGTFLLSQGVTYSDPSPEAGAISLDSLINEARKNNPEILAARKRYEAAKARIPQAKSLGDPSVGITFGKTKGSPFQLSKTMPEDRMLSVTQAFPFFGKLPLKGKIALVESQMAAAALKEKELDVTNEIKRAYYELSLNYKETELNRLSLEFLQNIMKIAQAKYATGAMSQEDLLKLHLETARLDTGIINLSLEKHSMETRLNTLLNRDAEGPLGVPQIDEYAGTLPDIKSLYQQAILNQPELIIFSYAIQKNKYAASLAKKNIFPDIMSGIVMRGITSGSIGPWDLMLAFSVPLWFWTKQRYQIKEAVANLDEAQAIYQAMQNKAFAHIKDLVVKIEVARNQMNLYKNSLIPVIEDSLDSSLSSFSSGKGDMMALLDSQRMLIESRIKYYQAVVDFNNALHDLERAIGQSLEEVKK